MNHYDLPSTELLKQQAEWLAPARARALRRVGIAKRRKILDLACGFGAVTEELSRRAAGDVVAMDCRRNVLASDSQSFLHAGPICGNALQLPFADKSFDLVFCQFTLLWIDAKRTIKEVDRILQPGGVFVAIEPDYGGMIEYPDEIATRDIWIAALSRAGADPFIGRKLPSMMHESLWKVEINLLDQILPPSPVRFELLRELPLSEDEKNTLSKIEANDANLSGSKKVVHLPILMIICEKQ